VVSQGKNRKKIQENQGGRRQTGGQAPNPDEETGRHEENWENRAPLTAFVHEIAS
jgi:hypothetical protein